MAIQGSKAEIELVIDSTTPNVMVAKRSLMPLRSILTKFHAGYFRISLSLGGQALLWKTLIEPTQDTSTFRGVLRMLHPTVFLVLWSLALFVLLLLSLLYLLRCLFFFKMVKAEYLHRVGVNYLFAPSISWLLLLQSAPFVAPKSVPYLVLWWVFAIPVVLLDVKIYGQWFTKGKRFLSTVANPTSQLSVIGNLVGAQAAAHMGWKESAVCFFSLGMVHYLVLFVTLYQRLSGGDRLPVLLRPVFFLFFAAPSVASLAWESIVGAFDTASKMLFFLSLFLFMSLVIGFCGNTFTGRLPHNMGAPSTDLQASPLQEIYEKIQCSMVGILLSGYRACSGFHGLCTRSQRNYSARPNAPYVTSFLSALPCSNSRHFAQL